MRDHQLRALMQVAESGSIRAAARDLNLSQSALTKALRELEESVGAALVSRSYRGVEFTPAGQALLTRARLSRSMLQKAQEEISALKGGSGVRVALAMTPVVAAAVMTKAFREFERIAPDVQIALVEGLPSIAIPALIEGRIDFAFAIANSKELPFELSFRELAKIETAIGCRKSHPLESAKRWSELQDARWALNLSAGSQGNQLLRWMRERGMGEPKRLTYCDSPLLMSDLMRRADRLCVGPKTLFSDPIFGHQMSLIAVEPAPPDMVLGVITLKGVPLTHAASQLLSCFERHLRGIR